jgi:hypothetical protein
LACGSLNNLAKSDASFGDWYLVVVMLQRRSSA